MNHNQKREMSGCVADDEFQSQQGAWLIIGSHTSNIKLYNKNIIMKITINKIIRLKVD